MIDHADIQEQFDEIHTHFQHIISEKSNGLKLIDILQQVANYYENIIHSLPGNVYWFDKDCVAIGANQNVFDQLKISSPVEFKGLRYEDIAVKGGWGNEETEFFKQQSLAVIASGQALLNIEEPPIPDLHGNPTCFLSSRVPLFGYDKSVIGCVGISIDITELKQTQQKLIKAKEVAEQASHAKSEFVSNMSHDIKTPLTGIIGLAELLFERAQNEDERSLAKTMLMSGNQLLSFVETCMDTFRLENNNPLAEEQFNLLDLLTQVNDLFKPSMMLKNVPCYINIDSACQIHLIGNKATLFRILSNLVSNAVKFTEVGSLTINVKSLIIDAEKQEQLLEFCIIDTGIGIPADKHDVIFDRFTRLSPSYKGIYDGYGLGLYIVDKFVKAMNGTISVKSEIQKGSTFTITIPFKYPSQQELQDTAQSEQPFQQLTGPLPPLRILIVEDHPVAQLLHSTLLTSMGHTITLTQSGEDAVEIFSPELFDLVFMDLGLPGIQGDIASQIIRKKEQNYNNTRIPIIALTAHVSEDMNKIIREKGIDVICSKPLTREKAQFIIHKLLSVNLSHETHGYDLQE